MSSILHERVMFCV